MKILIVHEIDWFNKVVFEPHHLAEIFSQKGNEVFVIDCQNPNIRNIHNGLRTQIIKHYNRVYENASITIIRPPSLLLKGFNRITHFFSCKKVIKKTLIDNEIDIVLLYGAATNGIQTIQAAKELNIPVIYRVLDISHGLVKIPLIRELAKHYEKIVIQSASHVLTTTPDLARYVVEMGAKSGIVESFSLGINITVFKPTSKDVGITTEFGISDKDTVIVFIGTIYDFAGLENLISKFYIIKKAIPQVKFLIVGGGPVFNKIKSLAEKNPDVVLVGFKPQKDIPRYISVADICVNPFEVNYVTNRILPTKILEYLACGKPVISTPLRGTKEILPSDEFGIIYSDSERFVETLCGVLVNKEKLSQLGAKGYTYVKNNHDWNVLSDELLSKFKKIRSDFK